MIKFFRKIRQNLLNEGKTTRYFKYAIGEIVLVVIGILIALQINNWNEARKATIEEITLLKNIQQDIELDKLDMNFNIKLHKQMLKAENKLLAFLQSDLNEPQTPIDYTNALGFRLISIIHKSTFNNLINNDISIISNNKLKKTITRFYDYFVDSLLKMENETEEYDSYLIKKAYFKKYFKLDDKLKNLGMDTDNNEYQYNPNLEKQSLLLNDAKGAKQDNAFQIELNESMVYRNGKISNYTNLLKKIDELNAAIDTELNKLEQ
jgi:hypothetical protein